MNIVFWSSSKYERARRSTFLKEVHKVWIKLPMLALRMHRLLFKSAINQTNIFACLVKMPCKYLFLQKSTLTFRWEWWEKFLVFAKWHAANYARNEIFAIIQKGCYSNDRRKRKITFRPACVLSLIRVKTLVICWHSRNS